MIDYDEMNEVLGQADREFAEKAGKKHEEEPVPDGWSQEQPYVTCMEMMRRTKESLERKQEAVREEYAKAVKGDETANKELGGAVYGLALHTIAYPVICGFFITIHVRIQIK